MQTKEPKKPTYVSLGVLAEVAAEFKRIAASKRPRWRYSELLDEMNKTYVRKQLRNGK